MRPRKPQGLSIFTRLALAFIGVTVGVCSLLLVTTYSFYQRSITQHTRESLVQQLAITRDRFLQEYGVNLTRTLRALSTSVVLDDHLLSSQVERLITSNKVQRAFQQALRDVSSCQSIAFVEPLGKAEIRATADRTRLGVETRHRPVGAAPSAAVGATTRLVRQLAARPAGTIHIEGPFIDDQAQVGFIAGLSKLDLDTGELAGVLLIQHRLADFFAVLGQVTVMGARPVWVFAPDGRLLHQPADASVRFDPRPHLLPADQPEPRVITVDGGLVAYQDYILLPGQPFFRVAVSIPTALLFQDLRPALHFFSLVFGISLGVVLVLALTLSRYLAKPIVALAAAATQVAQGEADVHVAVQAGGEVQLLVESFNQMADNLRQTTVSRDALAQEVIERQRTEAALHEAKGAAETANQAKSDFLANMSHELRTPLHGILSFADLGLERWTTATPERLGQYFSKIHVSGKVLLALLNDLLDLARLEAGKMTFDFQPGDLRSVLSMVKDEFQSLLSERSLTLHYAPPRDPVFVCVDRQRLMQVLRNLLSNAVKFSPQSGTITLHLSSHAETVQVTVYDQGPGIPPDELETIFNKFIQSSTTKTGAGGTGLGLAICREIMTAHQGCIWAKNRPEGGVVLTCELPQGLMDAAISTVDEAATHSHSGERSSAAYLP
ncbi:MAG: HAMP domain-containing histidine kinase [Candidatus Tectomicrobia bacterium]|nr:HAMP domain-containing histidine kinase [Candidatus Tectomicrobia bacterium]